jgi:hypothetical protein
MIKIGRERSIFKLKSSGKEVYYNLCDEQDQIFCIIMIELFVRKQVKVGKQKTVTSKPLIKDV